jgi:hypothetical protein
VEELLIHRVEGVLFGWLGVGGVGEEVGDVAGGLVAEGQQSLLEGCEFLLVDYP